MSKPPESTVDHSTLIKAQFSALNTAGIGDQSISSSVQAWILSMVQASLGRRTQSFVSLSVAREYARQHLNACYHDRLPSETTETDWHVRPSRRGKPVQHDCSPDWHPRLHRRRGIEARPHSGRCMIDWMASETTEEREAGYVDEC